VAITWKRGNLLEDDAQCLVNCVNCVGVAGAGIALAFKERFPENYEDYKIQCVKKLLRPGMVLLHSTGQRTILNAATKDHWRDPSRMSWILDIAESLFWYLRDNKVSMAIPALGCGRGGLKWREVKPFIKQYLGDINADVRVYEPMESA